MIKNYSPYLLLSAILMALACFRSSIPPVQATELSRKEYIDPEVIRHTNVLPPEVCAEIIRLGEESGFPLEYDSIDNTEISKEQNTYSQAIDVMGEDGSINHEAIYNQLEPYIPNMAKLIMEQRNEELHHKYFPDDDPNRLPKLGWIFYRKYSPETERNSLVPHTDTNMHTINIALNEDFEGGGVFYVRPKLVNNPEWDPHDPSFDPERLDRGDEKDGIPVIERHQWTYEWTDSLVRQNSSDVVFPKLSTGDALIHNYTVWHAVAPIEHGTRYSMVLFFDMDNPMVRLNDDDDDEDEEDEDEDEEDDFETAIFIRHVFKYCDPDTGRLKFSQDPIDIIWISPEKLESEKRQRKQHRNQSLEDLEAEGLIQVVSEDLSPRASEEHLTYVGETFRAYWSEDVDETADLDSLPVLATIRVEEGKTKYKVEGDIRSQHDCDSILQNEL